MSVASAFINEGFWTTDHEGAERTPVVGFNATVNPTPEGGYAFVLDTQRESGVHQVVVIDDASHLEYLIIQASIALAVVRDGKS